MLRMMVVVVVVVVEGRVAGMAARTQTECAPEQPRAALLEAGEAALQQRGRALGVTRDKT